MAKVVVIGAAGHVGTYLVPRLVETGHDVVTISRGQIKPYLPHQVWSAVDQRQMDRQAMEKAGEFGSAIRGLKPDIVIVMICFKLENARHLVETLSGDVGHFCIPAPSGPTAIRPSCRRRRKRPSGEIWMSAQ